MKDWSKEFNTLPLKTRRIGQAMETLTRIQHLKMEKERLRQAYQRSCKEINAHISSCEDSLIRYSRQWANQEAREINEDVQRDNGMKGRDDS